MPQCHFTDGSVRRLKLPKHGGTYKRGPKKGQRKPPPGQVDYFEHIRRGRTLVLTLNKGSRHTWSILYYVRGKPRRRKIGYFGDHDTEFPDLNCREAYELASTYKLDAAMAANESFRGVVEDWFKWHAGQLRSASELRRLINKHVLPEWGDCKFVDVRRRDVTLLLDKVQRAHTAGVANSVLACLSSLMSWYQSRGDDYVSPIVKRMRRQKAVKRDRVLNDEEIRDVWTACDEMGQFGAIVKLLLLTAQRREKVVSMKWADLNEQGVWTIASEPGEKDHAGSLKLPRLALDIIDSQERLAKNPYVFGVGRVRKEKHGHFNSFSQRKAELNKKLTHVAPWRLHDLRRTARTLMSRIGVRPDIAERTLGHVQGGVEEIYDRYSYDAEKAEALGRLSSQLLRIINAETTVLPFPASRV